MRKLALVDPDLLQELLKNNDSNDNNDTEWRKRRISPAVKNKTKKKTKKQQKKQNKAT